MQSLIATRELGSGLWIWTLDPLELVPLLVVALLYERRLATLSRQARSRPRAYRLAFHAGLITLLVAYVSPLDWLGGERLFVAHMGQHVLLGDVAPLLLVLGLDGPILRPVLALRPVAALRRLGHPLVALPLWAADLYIWHAPRLYELALANAGVHALEHLCFLAGGLLLWAAVVEPLPAPRWFGYGAKCLYVLVARGLEMVLANLLAWSGTLFYPTYATFPRVAPGLTPLVDQGYGGAVMLVEGSIVTIAMLAWLFNAWASDSELRQQLEERGLDARGGTGRRAVVGRPRRAGTRR